MSKRPPSPKPERNPRILVVTPEIAYVPRKMGSMAGLLRAKAGGLADVSASLVAALFELGAHLMMKEPGHERANTLGRRGVHRRNYNGSRSAFKEHAPLLLRPSASPR